MQYMHAEYFSQVLAGRNTSLLVRTHKYFPFPLIPVSQHRELCIYINIKMTLYIWNSHPARFLNFVFLRKAQHSGLLELEVAMDTKFLEERPLCPPCLPKGRAREQQRLSPRSFLTVQNPSWPQT